MEEHGVIPDVIDTAPTDEAEVSRDATFLLFAPNFVFGSMVRKVRAWRPIGL
jgi:hypothetical protein